MNYRIITLTQGNLNNNHLYLKDAWQLIPDDVVDGGNESESASRTLEINYGSSKTIITDVAGDKKIFRKRAWVREFFRMHQLKAGSRVVIEKAVHIAYTSIQLANYAFHANAHIKKKS
ncbi:MAG TPA: hypothetical protein VGB00_07200 [Pyrinomonadaceae bacterium]